MIDYLRAHPRVVKRMLLGYIVFAGCFTFPISSEPFPLDWMKLYLLVAGYGIIAGGFVGLWGAGKLKQVYGLTLAFTLLGLLCRYLLEFGEVSNTYNFTLINTVSYLGLIPLGVALAYFFGTRRKAK